MTHTAPDGEVHRADIETPTGIVIEVQHSTMPDDERESRESFYGNLIWILDGRSFRKNFHLGCMLPDPDSGAFEDIVWIQFAKSAYRGSREPMADKVPAFWRISDVIDRYPGLTKANIGAVLPPDESVRFHNPRKIQDQVRAHYSGHHQFYWIRPRRMWFDATCPVYIDFDETFLYRIEEYDETRSLCVRLVPKQKLIHDAMVEKRAKDVATRFYPIA